MVRIIVLVLLHILGDFFLQGSKLSKRKRAKIPSLLVHTGIYTLPFIILSPVLLHLSFLQGLEFSLLNGVLHFGLDFVTGKIKKKYWQVDEDKYYTAIGLDQTLHIIILIVTYLMLFPNILNAPLGFEHFDKVLW